MAMEPAIRKLTIQNLLSFRDTTVELRNLNVLIGPNGSGKTNLIEVLGLLHNAPKDIGRVFSSGGGFDEWVWKGRGELAAASIEAIAGGPDAGDLLRYYSEFTRNGFNLSVYEKFESILDQGGPARFDPTGVPGLDPHFSVLAQLRDPEHHPNITYLGILFSRIRIYREWDFGPGSSVRQPCDAGLSSRQLEEDGSNLGVVLAGLLAKPPVKRQLLEYLRLFNENATDLRTSSEAGRIQTRLEENHLNQAIPLVRMSDGTIRWLALMTILLNPDPPPLVCIEEPELGLHPDMIHELGKLLIDASSRMQIVITTHSDRLVEEFTEMPEAVVVCEKHDGASTFRRLDGQKLSAWLKDYSLGQLWTEGQIGGTRW